jgi:hypothetical protein
MTQNQPRSFINCVKRNKNGGISLMRYLHFLLLYFFIQQWAAHCCICNLPVLVVVGSIKAVGS